MVAGKGNLDQLHRGLRTIIFILTMLASLLISSAPVIVAVLDSLLPCILLSSFACICCPSFVDHLRNYSFRTCLIDIPLASIVRSLLITCVYAFSDGPALYTGPYLGTSIACSFVCIFVLSVKACLFTAMAETGVHSFSRAHRKLHMKRLWGIPLLFLSSLLLAIGHMIVAYRSSCKARRKFLFHITDPEAVLSCKNIFSGGYQKVPRSPTPMTGRMQRCDSDAKRRHANHAYDDLEIPISLLIDDDSLFQYCQGLVLHYKHSLPEADSSPSLGSVSCLQSTSNHAFESMTPGRLKHTKPSFSALSKMQKYHSLHRSSSLCAPLLAGCENESSILDEMYMLDYDGQAMHSDLIHSGNAGCGKFGVVLVHGFGGGVFSWRHVMRVLALQVGCSVAAFDRPGWGLTSRLQRKHWEEKQMPNPYTLDSQVDLLLSFCLAMGFTSVVFVGHDDGGLLVLKAVEKLKISSMSPSVEVKGIVLLNVDLSREVIPGFARILLHTSLGKKHMVRPLLRTEITQVVNRRAWYDATKLTAEILNLYKAPLCVEGWDDALQEISKLSYTTVLSPDDAASLLKSVHDVPVMVVSGSEDSLVSFKSLQAMALKLENSRLVAISGCGHLPHEECPEALLSALSPFIAKLLRAADQHSM